VQRVRGGLVVKAHRLLYHSTLGLRVIKKKRRVSAFGFRVSAFGFRVPGFGVSAFRVESKKTELQRGSGFQVSGFGFRVSGVVFRVPGFGSSSSVLLSSLELSDTKVCEP